MVAYLRYTFVLAFTTLMLLGLSFLFLFPFLSKFSMKKILSTLVASLFVVAAFAQTPAPTAPTHTNASAAPYAPYAATKAKKVKKVKKTKTRRTTTHQRAVR